MTGNMALMFDPTATSRVTPKKVRELTRDLVRSYRRLVVNRRVRVWRLSMQYRNIGIAEQRVNAAASNTVSDSLGKTRRSKAR